MERGDRRGRGGFRGAFCWGEGYAGLLVSCCFMFGFMGRREFVRGVLVFAAFLGAGYKVVRE